MTTPISEMKMRTTSNPLTQQGTDEIQPLIDQVYATAVQTVARISQDSLDRLKSPNAKDLDQGVYYANDYHHAMVRHEKDRTNQFFIDNGLYYQGIAPTSHFKYIPSERYPTKKWLLTYKIKDGAVPTEALEKFQQGITFADCGACCSLGWYEGLVKVWGKDKFNKIYAPDSKSRLTLAPLNSNCNSITSIARTGLDTSFVQGEIYNFQNAQQYRQKHLNGEAAGLNVLCSDATQGAEKFVGLGLPEQGISAPEIREFLRSEFNKPCIDTCIVTEDLAKKIFDGTHPHILEQHNKLAKKTLGKIEFIKLGGGKLNPTKWTLNREKVYQIAKGDPDEVQEIYTS